MSKSSGFIFYDRNSDAAADWALTLDVIYHGPDREERTMSLTRRLVEFAAEFGLAGNVWQQWMAYILITHENPYTLACERRTVEPDSTVSELVKADLEQFMEFMHMDMPGDPVLGSFTDYKAPYPDAEMSRQGVRLTELASSLSGASDAETFRDIISGYHSVYGTGIYGLYRAFRVDDSADRMRIVPVTDETDVSFDDLIGYEEQKARLKENTEAFVSGGHANNVLLYGDSGTGKSTSIHALMHDYYDRGLRLIELSKQNRTMLPQVLSEIKKRNYRFIIFLDDLSFEENESDYKELKAMLEGALETRSDRVLIYATSNRRHLIRETWSDRSDMEYENDIHHSDTMEEKLSLAGRFGVTIYYSKPTPKEYLNIVRELTARNGIDISGKELDDIARKWELRHGGMSGRTASQLITYLQGQTSLDK